MHGHQSFMNLEICVPHNELNNNKRDLGLCLQIHIDNEHGSTCTTVILFKNPNPTESQIQKKRKKTFQRKCQNQKEIRFKILRKR
jgi:hypothetical protein